jgi:hypothetical protein
MRLTVVDQVTFDCGQHLTSFLQNALLGAESKAQMTKVLILKGITNA